MRYTLSSLLLLLSLFLYNCGQSSVNETEKIADKNDVSSESQATQQSSVKAPISVDGGATHQLGRIWKGSSKKFFLNIRNTSDIKLTIEEVEATCACTQLEKLEHSIDIAPHGQWKLDLLLDSNHLSMGEFVRSVIIRTKEYAPYKLDFTGNVETFYQIKTSKKKKKNNNSSFPNHGDSFEFPHIIHPDDKWSASCDIIGTGAVTGILELSLDEQSNANLPFTVALVKKSAGEWHIKANSNKPLPFGEGIFRKSISLKVENKLDGIPLPNINLTLCGKVGEKLAFTPGRVTVRKEDFENKKTYSFDAQLGFDSFDEINQQKDTRQKRSLKYYDKLISNVDWPHLNANLTMPQIEGVTIKYTPLTYGVKLNITLSQECFKNSRTLNIKPLYMNNPIPGVTVHLSEIPHVPSTKANDKQ